MVLSSNEAGYHCVLVPRLAGKLVIEETVGNFLRSCSESHSTVQLKQRWACTTKNISRQVASWHLTIRGLLLECIALFWLPKKVMKVVLERPVEVVAGDRYKEGEFEAAGLRYRRIPLGGGREVADRTPEALGIP